MKNDEKLLKLLRDLITEVSKNEDELNNLKSELYNLNEEVHDELWPYMEEDLWIYNNIQNDIEKVVDWINNPTTNYPLSYYKNKIEKLRGKEE
jgi:hypothetical protein